MALEWAGEIVKKSPNAQRMLKFAFNMIDDGLVGQQIFAGTGICFTCHGQDATGTQLAPNLTDDEWINIEQPVTQEKIEQLVRTGVQQPKQHPAPMPAMGGAQLDDQQVRAVSAYVYSLTHPNG
mgnify:CR=1 FL=1